MLAKLGHKRGMARSWGCQSHRWDPCREGGWGRVVHSWVGDKQDRSPPNVAGAREVTWRPSISSGAGTPKGDGDTECGHHGGVETAHGNPLR